MVGHNPAAGAEDDPAVRLGAVGNRVQSVQEAYEPFVEGDSACTSGRGWRREDQEGLSMLFLLPCLGCSSVLLG